MPRHPCALHQFNCAKCFILVLVVFVSDVLVNLRGQLRLVQHHQAWEMAVLSSCFSRRFRDAERRCDLHGVLARIVLGVP